MKRNIIITFLITLLLLVAGIFVSKHDSVKYKNVMNRNGVSEDALIVKAKSKQTIVSALQKIAKHDDLKFKIHFISKKNPDKSFFYSQNEKLSLPIKDGRNFSNLDFSAAVPFVIVGKDVKNIIKPQEQSYLKLNNRYLSVIGMIEMDGESNLNQHIFTSISPKMADNQEKVSDYQVILDGVYSHRTQTLNVMKKAFHANRIVSSANKINNVKQNIVEKNSTEFVVLAIISALIVVLNFNMIVPMKYSINNSQLDGDLQQDFKVGFIFLFIVYNIIALAVSYFIIHNWILIINHTPLTWFFIANIFFTIILGCYVIFTKNRRLLH